MHHRKARTVFGLKLFDDYKFICLYFSLFITNNYSFAQEGSTKSQQFESNQFQQNIKGVTVTNSYNPLDNPTAEKNRVATNLQLKAKEQELLKKAGINQDPLAPEPITPDEPFPNTYHNKSSSKSRSNSKYRSFNSDGAFQKFLRKVDEEQRVKDQEARVAKANLTKTDLVLKNPVVKNIENNTTKEIVVKVPTSKINSSEKSNTENTIKSTIAQKKLVLSTNPLPIYGRVIKRYAPITNISTEKSNIPVLNGYKVVEDTPFTAKNTILPNKIKPVNDFKPLAKVNEKLIVAKGKNKVLESNISTLTKENELILSQINSWQEKEMEAIKNTEDLQVKLQLALNQVERLKKGTTEQNINSIEDIKENENMIATVSAPKLNLRIGPGFEHAPLMVVSFGSKLTVITKQGNWYQVIAPTGVKAWVAASSVDVGDNTPEEQFYDEGNNTQESDTKANLEANYFAKIPAKIHSETTTHNLESESSDRALNHIKQLKFDRQ
jgi:SH3-like domain-containing protein